MDSDTVHLAVALARGGDEALSLLRAAPDAALHLRHVNPDPGHDLLCLPVWDVRVAAEEASVPLPSGEVLFLETALDRVAATSPLVTPHAAAYEFRGETPPEVAQGSLAPGGHPVAWASAMGVLCTALRWTGSLEGGAHGAPPTPFFLWPVSPDVAVPDGADAERVAVTLGLLGTMCARVYELVRAVFVPVDHVLRSPNPRAIKAAAESVIGRRAEDVGLAGDTRFEWRAGQEGGFAADHILSLVAGDAAPDELGGYPRVAALARVVDRLIDAVALDPRGFPATFRQDPERGLEGWGGLVLHGATGADVEGALLDALEGEKGDVGLLRDALDLAAHALVRAVATRLHGDPARLFPGSLRGRSSDSAAAREGFGLSDEPGA